MTPAWLPVSGDVFVDDRGGHRTMRVSWHSDKGVVVLSLWRGGLCTGTFRVRVQDVAELVAVLRQGLGQSYDQVREDGVHQDAASDAAEAG